MEYVATHSTIRHFLGSWLNGGVLGLEMANDGLDGGAAFHLAADRSGDRADLAGDPDPEPV